MSIPDFSDGEWEELLSFYQTLINIVHEARANHVPSPEFNNSFVAVGDCNNDGQKKYFSDLLQQAFLITPTIKSSPCQKPVSWFIVSTM